MFYHFDHFDQFGQKIEKKLENKNKSIEARDDARA